MQVFRVNTTAYKEEDFFILTTLTEEEIVEVIKPIVQEERFGRDEYENDDLINALQKRYPRKKIELYSEFQLITI